MRQLAAVSLFALLLPATFSSCGVLFSVRAEESVIRPGASIQVTTAGRLLAGKALGDILRESATTIREVELSSGVMRRAVQAALPAVVNLYTETSDSYRVHLLGIPLPGTSFALAGQALGSGFICHPDGYVLTNNHVIEGATTVIALTLDQKAMALELLARDPALDVALLRITGSGAPFPFLPLGNSEEVAMGDVVLAIGNPLGLNHSVTQGIISQKHRNIPEVEEQVGRKLDYIQTDTAINPGNSGGPLITLAHAAIGINTSVLANAAGIGFVVPAHRIREFLEAVLRGQGQLEQRK